MLYCVLRTLKNYNLSKFNMEVRMTAVLEEEKEAKPVKVVIPEDTDTMVVRFQNLEQKGVPLEFSAGAPISTEIRNYVLKDGLVYNLGKRLRRHITSLCYPEYKNVVDPNFPDGEQKRSMQSGVVRRFALTPVDDINVTVYEHLREKLNHKVLPGALKNSSNLPDTGIKNSNDIIADKAVKENMRLEKDNNRLMGDNKDLVYTVNKLKRKLEEKKDK